MLDGKVPTEIGKYRRHTPRIAVTASLDKVSLMSPVSESHNLSIIVS